MTDLKDILCCPSVSCNPWLAYETFYDDALFGNAH